MEAEALEIQELELEPIPPRSNHLVASWFETRGIAALLTMRI